jgi:hypothetical protein
LTSHSFEAGSDIPASQIRFYTAGTSDTDRGILSLNDKALVLSLLCNL